MRKTILTFVLVLGTSSLGFAVQIPVTQITTAIPSVGALKSEVNTRFQAVQTNTSDLYTNKADKSTAVQDWSAWADGSVFVANMLVAYQGQIYKCTQPYTKHSGETPAAMTAYWSATGGSGVSSYNDLADKPSIPATLAALTGDSTHRVVTDAEKAAWDAKQSALTAGTDYLAPNGSAANLINFPTLNQNTTGNAATATALQTPQAASATPFSATSGISATTVQAAIEEVKAESTVPTGSTGQIPVYNSSGGQVATTPLTPVAGANITLTTDATAGTVTIASNGGATYPGAGIPQSTGSAWGTSITPGTGVATALAAAVDGTGGLASKALVDTITAGSFAFDTYPTYEDSAHSGSGIAVNGTTLAVYSSTAGKWLTVGLTDSLAPAPDTTPDTFTFGDTHTDATVSTQYCSASITPTGFNSAASIVSTGTGTNKGWKIDGGAFSTTGTLSPGSTIQTCHESSASDSTSTTSSLTIGGIVATAPFTITTASAPIVAFCSGTNTFCTSWETGSDAQNTGASDNEGIFTSLTGTVNKLSSGCAVGNSCVQYNGSANYLSYTNSGSGFGNFVNVSLYFRVDAENANAGSILAVRDNTSYYGVLTLKRNADTNISDLTVPMSLVGKFTSSTEVQAGSNFNVNVGVWYKATIAYNTTTDVSRVYVYLASDDSLIFDSGDIATTLSMTIDEIRLNNNGSGNVSIDGIKIN